jgi:alkylated DNA nucleotide flippase Atl1
MAENSTQLRSLVHNLVSNISRGRVMSCSQIAALCENGRVARMVVGIAHFGDTALPWRRVINKTGGLASGFMSGRAGYVQCFIYEDVHVDNDLKLNVSEY